MARIQQTHIEQCHHHRSRLLPLLGCLAGYVVEVTTSETMLTYHVACRVLLGFLEGGLIPAAMFRESRRASRPVHH